jgi:mono/diheme cytochrome c family protein
MIPKRKSFSSFPFIWFVTVVVLIAGCERPKRPPEFEKNYVFAMRIAEQSEAPMDQILLESGEAMVELFGTPEKPKLPEIVEEHDKLKNLVDLKRVTQGLRVYREHCVKCHGSTGEGRGPVGATLDPYPRDFRLGLFKFKTTPRGTKPTPEDLARTIKMGIPGTGMVRIEKLSEDDVQALTEVVIFLSWRGQVERALLKDCEEIGWDEQEHLFDRESKGFAEQVEFMHEHVVEIGESWLKGSESVVDVDLPQGPPMLGPDNLNDPEVVTSIARGKKIYLSEVSSCAKCHGPEGKGDGQNTDFDDWAKDWASDWIALTRTKPMDETMLVPRMARGALPPRVIKPRNFQEGIFRGGADPTDLYRRILLGIEGTPMPGATMKSATVTVGLSAVDVWDLVNYVRSLKK